MMNSNDNTLRHLAARVSSGDIEAAAELRQQLQPHLRRIARRALRPGAAASPLTRRVRAVAERLPQNEACESALAVPVALSLGESLVGRLQGQRGAHRVMETLCD
jgi:hypothetical protein